MDSHAQIKEHREGGCLCGAVRFRTGLTSLDCGACHCEMCRRWTGSALVSTSVSSDHVEWQGEDVIGRVQSSDWAERAFCTRCGSGLYYRVTMDGPYADMLTLPVGVFDDANGFVLRREIYIDHKPDCFAYAGERLRLTRAETLAEFGISEGEN